MRHLENSRINTPDTEAAGLNFVTEAVEDKAAPGAEDIVSVYATFAYTLTISSAPGAALSSTASVTKFSPARAMRFEEKRTLWLPVREALESDEKSPRVRSHFPSETGAGHDNPADTDKKSGNF